MPGWCRPLLCASSLPPQGKATGVCVEDAQQQARGGAAKWIFPGGTFDDATGLNLQGVGPVPLRSKPAHVLAVLLECAPQAATKDLLLQRVWKRSEATVSRTVLSNAVLALRQALGPDRAGWIESTPGRYRFSLPVAREGEALRYPTCMPVQVDELLARLVADLMSGRAASQQQDSLHAAVRRRVEQMRQQGQLTPLLLGGLHLRMGLDCEARAEFAGAVNHLHQARAVLMPAATPPQEAAAPGDLLSAQLAAMAAFHQARSLSMLADEEEVPHSLAQAQAVLLEAQALLARVAHPSLELRMCAAQCAAVTQLLAREPQRALEHAREVEALVHQQPQLDRHMRFRMLKLKAACLLWMGRVGAAIAAFESLLADLDLLAPELDLMRQNMVFNLALCHWAAGDFQACSRLLEPLCRGLPPAGEPDADWDYDAACLLGSSWNELGRHAQAAGLLQAAHGRVLQHASFTSERALQAAAPLACAWFHVGRRSEALALLEQAVGPRLAQLWCGGQAAAALALAQWIELLAADGQQSAAQDLLPLLDEGQLRHALPGPGAASAWVARLRAACAPPQLPAADRA